MSKQAGGNMHVQTRFGAINVERVTRGVLYAVLTLFWFKLAYDLTIGYWLDPEVWGFPIRALAIMAIAAVSLALLNICVLWGPEPYSGPPIISARGRLLIIAAFLASYAACNDPRPAMKFLDMYVLIPAMILLVARYSADVSKLSFRMTILLLAAVLLLPNDICRNPQNAWWIDACFASPLTYALPVNVLLYLSEPGNDKRLLRVSFLIVVAYYFACLFHRWTGNY
jgi:hypothetical protein